MSAVIVIIEPGAPVVRSPARFHRRKAGKIVGVAECAALMRVFKLAVHEVTEKALIPKRTQVHRLFHERIIFEQVVDSAGIDDGFRHPDSVAGGEETGDFTHDVLSRGECLDGMVGVGGEERCDQYGVEIQCQKFILVGRDERIGGQLAENCCAWICSLISHLGDHVDVERLS